MATTATRKSRASASKPETSSSRHQRKCTICHHADREEIEQMFLHWFSASSIYRRFLLKDRSTIYDHAHATGLYSRRRKNMRCALENIIERSDECPVSSNGIVRAIKAYYSVTDAGEWIEPASRVVYTSTSDSAAPGLSPARTHAKVPSTTVPGTTVDGWNCRSGDVRGTPLPSSTTPLANPPSQNMSHSSLAPHSQNCNVGPDSVRAEGVRTTPLPSVSHVTTTDAPVAPQKNPPQTTAPEPLTTGHSSLLSNRYNKLLETDATHTKQRTGPHSNRYK